MLWHAKKIQFMYYSLREFEDGRLPFDYRHYVCMMYRAILEALLLGHTKASAVLYHEEERKDWEYYLESYMNQHMEKMHTAAAYLRYLGYEVWTPKIDGADIVVSIIWDTPDKSDSKSIWRAKKIKKLSELCEVEQKIMKIRKDHEPETADDFFYCILKNLQEHYKEEEYHFWDESSSSRFISLSRIFPKEFVKKLPRNVSYDTYFYLKEKGYWCDT